MIENALSKSPKKRVTLADVASKAGVSVATASVAITGRPSGNCRVSPEVAEKIRRIARSLNYRPNLQARNLSTQRTRTVALLIKRSAWHNAMHYVSAAQHVLRQRGYAEICMLHPDDRIESEREHIETCLERRVEGILAIPLIDLNGRANTDLFNKVHQDEGIPVVHVGLALPGSITPAIVTDEVEGIRQGVRLLHAMGHERIAHLTINGYDNPDPLNPFGVAYQRYLGYLKGMKELGLPSQVFYSREDCLQVMMLYDRGFALAPEVIKASPRPTAIIAFSDYTSAGLIAGLHEAKINVPGEISVLSIGEQPFGRMLRPALSTLAPQFEKMGELATQTLLKMIDGGEGESAALAPSLIMRDTIREITAR